MKPLHQPQAGPSLITAAKLARGGLFATLYGDADLYGLSTLGVTEHEAIDFSSDGDGYASGWPANDTAVSVLATDFSVRYHFISFFSTFNLNTPSQRGTGNRGPEKYGLNPL